MRSQDRRGGDLLIPVLELGEQFQAVRVDQHRGKFGFGFLRLLGLPVDKTDPLRVFFGGVFSLQDIFDKFLGRVLHAKPRADQQGTHRRSDTKTREVMWEVSRAKGTEHLEVKIKAKQTGTGLLADDDYVIKRGHNVVKSGEAVSGPGYGEQPIVWWYNICLNDGTNDGTNDGRDFSLVDPEIIIIHDP